MIKKLLPNNFSESKLILVVAISAMVVLTLKTLSQAIFSYRMTRFLAKIETDISSNLYKNIINSQVDSIQSFKFSDYQFALLVGASRACIGIINNFIMLITDSTITIFMGTLAFYASKTGFLISFLIILVIYFIVNKPVQKRAKIYGEKMMTTHVKIGSELLENLSGIKEIKTYGKEKVIFEEFLRVKKEHSIFGQRSIWINTLVRYFLEIAILFIGFFLILFLSLTTDVRHAVTIVVVFMAIGFRLIPNMQRIQNGFVTFKMSKEMTSSLFKIVEVFSEKNNFEKFKLAPEESRFEKLVLENVSFRYLDSSKTALRNISFELPSNTTLVVLGLSGSGKTTLADLIAGLNDPLDGKLSYVFSEKKFNLGKFRPSISYVSQGSSLFGDDVFENVSLSKSPSAEEKNLIASIASDFNLNFLNGAGGISREIRSDGSNISGGERQRVALARAKFQRSKIVIFDEPTSSLDPTNTNAVLKYIENLHGNCTVIIVTHSTELLNLADYVLTLDNSDLTFFGNLSEYRKLEGQS